MLGLEEWMNIKDLHRQGHSIRKVAQLTGCSRNTVRKILRQQRPEPVKQRNRQSKLDPFKPYLEERYKETGLSAVRLLAEVKQMGYTGSIDVVRRFLRRLDQLGRALARATVRFETPPGEQAQADWAYCGQWIDAEGIKHKVYAFVIILCFSRYLYVEFTTEMNIEQLITCHQQAFEFFGGWPKQILYDNMKQVRLSQSEWNPLFLDFLDHYGIQPRTHRIRRPRTKGKVERSVGYLKENFLRGNEFADFAELQAKGRNWLEQTANVRTHATTNARPVDLLEHEHLTPFGTIGRYQLSQKAERVVNSEGYVQFAKSRYSVPPEYVGKHVIVEQGEHQVVIRLRDTIIAEHTPAIKPGSCITQSEHVAQMWRLALGQQLVPEQALLKIGSLEHVSTTPLTVYEEVIS